MTVLIDFMSVYYRNWYGAARSLGVNVFDGLSDTTVTDKERELYTLASTRTLDTILKVLYNSVQVYDSDLRVYICLDGKKSLKRDAFPEYKAGRKNRLNKINRSEIKKICVELIERGAICAGVAGFEADDIAFSLIQTLPATERIACYSVDGDWLAFVRDNVDVYLWNSTVTGSSEYIRVTRDRFARLCEKVLKREVKFNDVTFYKSVAGDSSDNIKGVPGVGVKSFEKLMRDVTDEQVEALLTKQGCLDLGRQLFDGSKLEAFERSLELVWPLDVGEALNEFVVDSVFEFQPGDI
jgi:DNA polymerase-1